MGAPIDLKDSEVEAALSSGEQSGLLEDYFGAPQYAELKRLSQEAALRGVRGGERVFILPGIMGSKLGYPGALLFDDVIWADPVDIAAGRLTELRLDRARSRIRALGVMLFAYLKLKLKLKIAGYDPEFFPYDWRQGTVGLGEVLAAQIAADGSKKVHLVAHSMGGLVARALLLRKPRNLGRIITLGTPNYGSFSPIQAFRGSHSVVNKVAFLDVHHSSTDLADIFGGFPGLLEMIPAVEKYPVDFFDLKTWPAGGTHPSKTMLANARKAQQQLPIEYDELYQIVGIDQETIVDARVDGDEFVYSTSLAGDGTVPLQCALLPNAKRTYYVNESHGSLANNGDVARAVDAILAAGETTLLPDRYEPRRATLRTFSERALDQPAYQGNPGRALSAAETRHLLAEVAAPDAAAPPAPGVPGVAVTRPFAAADADMAETVVIGRRHAHSLDITLARGSITDIEADAYVLGMFRSVPPGGPAALLDDLLGGAIKQMVARRMFNANVGEVTIVPTGKHLVRADVVVFAGLGAFDTFSPDTFEIIGENLVRTFISTRIDDFATVPIGGASGAFSSTSLRKLMTGFLRGLKDADADHRFRGITICEADRGRYDALCAEFYKLCGTKLFDGVEVTLREIELAPRMQVAVRAAEAAAAPQDVFLLVREEPSVQAATVDYVSSVLTTGAKATVYKARQSIKKAELDQLLKTIDVNDRLTLEAVEAFGTELAEMILPDNVRKALARHLDSPLVIVHDAAVSRMPWETLRLENRVPALEAGLIHRYEAENLSIAKWLEERQRKPVLEVLLVINPTEDLPGAEAEGDRIEQMMKDFPTVSVYPMRNQKARRHEIARCLASGQFDVLHYAGHAFFDPVNPSRSGILCAGREVLSGADLSNLASLPSLAFFNACEAGRLRGGSSAARINPTMSTEERVRRGASFAEAFLRGGIANYLGTYWPVGDAAAKTFAETFYKQLLAGETLGAALKAGRHAILDARSPDWADYVLYGDPDFVLKQRPGG
ncbi:MAG: CHAT domain-containing protein [Xanthobacteraceae bacterium]